MRLLLLLITLMISEYLHAQLLPKGNAKAISQIEYESCKIKQPQLYNDTTTITPITLNKEEFEILGLITTELILMKSLRNNTYWLSHTMSGFTDPILGYPVFSSDSSIFGCVGYYDRRPTIRLYKVRSDGFDFYFHAILPKLPKELKCVNADSFMIRDTDDTYFKYTLER